jgi:hypothetical protein
MRTARLALAIVCVVLSTRAISGEQPYQLIENFTSVLPSSPSVTCEVNAQQAKMGLGSARLTYKLDANQRRAQLSFADGWRMLSGAGTLKVWIKGDGSGNEIEFVIRHAKTKTENDGRRVFFEHGQLQLPRVKLDFEDWREFSLDAKALPEGRVYWWESVQFHGQRPDPKKNPEPKMTGTVELDDLRLYPAANPPGAAFLSGLIGPATRTIGKEISIFADVRSFSAKAARVRARLAMMDRNGNKVAERDFPLDIDAFGRKEFKLDLEPENIEAYLPPFALSGDVLSTDLAEVSATIEQPVVMGNAMMLFDDFSNVYGRWFTAGYAQNIQQNQRQWMEWTHGESQRASTLLQTTAKISRVELKDADAKMPAVPNAMQIDFSGDAVVYSSVDRYMPGNPYRIGFWVKGDGSGAKLNALILDYTNGADFWAGGWKRIYNGELQVCTLDFKEWRYIELDLPGRGLGSNLPRGSTDALDFPLELTAFRIIPTATAATGSVQLGPIFVHTQYAATGTLSANIGYDDPNFIYDTKHNAWVSVQNGWLTGKRKVKAAWTLLDRAGEAVLSGQPEMELAAGQTQVVKIDLSTHVAAFDRHAGPFRLQCVVSDAADPSISVTKQVSIAKPESRALAADFESERGFYGWKAGAQWTAATSTEQAKSGKRSLKIEWDKEKSAQVAVAIDPALPGVCSEISLQVFGDGGGAILYPVIGGVTGVNHGGNQNNFFLLRRADDVKADDLQNGVRVDWKGWRELKFILPQIPVTWDQAGRVYPFIPTYPLGLHLMVDARAATGASGAVFVDDISVATHLEPAARVALSLERPNESNINPDGKQLLTLTSYETGSVRKIELSSGVYDWRNKRIGGQDSVIELKPGESRQVIVAEKLPPGAYAVRAQIKEGAVTLASAEDDLLVCDLQPYLGAEWLAALRDEWKLRAPIRDTFAFVDEDWDWVEHYPGNFQMDTIRERCKLARSQGGDPHVLLGYGAYWSAGVGFDQMKAGAFNRRQRDIGHAVDIFMVPARMDDWENYVSEAMRGAGNDPAGVGGWILWDNPDSSGPMKVDAPKFAQMIGATDRWRKEYCPKLPLLIGGMNRATAIPYLNQLREQKIGSESALEQIGGVQVRLDVGRMSPEDAEIQAYVRELREALKIAGAPEKKILLSDLDWAVEKDAAGLGAFDQAAYLSRSAFLLDEAKIQPLLSIRNEDSVRLGLGLVHRRRVTVPPMTEKVQAHDFKPAWWAMAQTRKWLEEMTFVSAIEIADVVPGRSQCLLYKRKDGKAIVVLWRNDDAGDAGFAQSGVSVELAQDVLATPVAAKDGWYSIGKMPVVFVMGANADNAAAALGKIWVRDGADAAWAQRVIATITPASGAQAQEKFSVKVPAGSGLVLQKRFVLDDAGQDAQVSVNGAAVGAWNLKRSEAKLSGGLRTASFLIPAEALAGKSDAEIEIKYAKPASTLSWRVLEYRGGNFPLSAMGAIHSDQNFGHPRFARNITGSRLKVGTTDFADGIGAFAQSLLEYPLNKQFSRFTAKVGVDAVTEGRGSVVFEVYADGKKIWASGVMSGLDQPKTIDVDVKGVDRLRLILTDAADGNKFDAGDWCEPALHK